MTNAGWTWWMKVAVVYSGIVPLLAIGNLAGGDSGPLSGKVLAVVAAAVTAGVIVAGLRLRLVGRRRLGSGLIALGVFPASALTAFLWFPPVAVLGVLALVVTVMAITDAIAAETGDVATTG